MKLISYYDLLGMIKEGNIPKTIKVQLCNVTYSKIYKAVYDCKKFTNYYLIGDEDDNYKNYLIECFWEESTFDKCIEIPNNDFENIEEIELGRISPNGEYVISVNDEKIQDKINSLIRNQRNIIEKLKDSDVK